MEPAVWIAMIGALVTVTATTVTPILINRQRAKNDLETKRIDWERQDEVARRVIEAAEAAKLVAVQQVDQADRAADLLAQNTKLVASKTEELTQKVDQVHILVNSNLTAERTERLIAKRETLDLLQELIEAGVKVPPKLVTRVASLKVEIEDLKAGLVDRAHQAALLKTEIAAQEEKK